MPDLISVVIATYGRTVTLKRAIVSVLKQTYKTIEIIVVNDNTDPQLKLEVRDIVNEIGDKRIRLVCNEQNIGGSMSRNVGIREANGKYIAFLDDDDEYMPEKIEKQYQLFMNSKDESLALVYCYCLEVGKKRIVYHYDFRGKCLYEAMKSCFAATSQWMCKRSALVKVGGFTDMPCKQDSTLLVKLLGAGYSVDRVPEILSIYNQDVAVRISTSSHKKRIAGEEILRDECRKHYYGFSKPETDYIEYLFCCRLLEHYFAVGDKKKVINCLKELTKHPLNVNTLRAIKHILLNMKPGCRI